jgi:hypothetical protein
VKADKNDRDAVRTAALRVIVANPGFRAGQIQAETIVRWVLPKGQERAMRAVDRALQALKRDGMIKYRRGWRATAKGLGAL